MMHQFETHYSDALRLHGETGLPKDCLAARQLGARAVRLGLETLDLAKIHEAVLEKYMTSGETIADKSAVMNRASLFFNEVLVPLEDEHRRIREAAAEPEGGGTAEKKSSDEVLATYPFWQEELRLLSRRLLSVQEEERKQISRELHDLIAETLTGINLQLALFESKAISDAEDFHEKIAQTQRLIEKSVETVHRFARDLRPAALDDLGLVPALQSHLEDFMRDTGIRVALTSFAGVEKLDNESRTALYRVAQEALRNVAQHAGASRVEVKIHLEGGTVCMEIHDDGKGFLVDVDAFLGEGSKRLGLLGMKERVEMAGGSFRVESNPGEGTIVFTEVPLRCPDTPVGPPARGNSQRFS